MESSISARVAKKSGTPSDAGYVGLYQIFVCVFEDCALVNTILGI